MKKIRTYTPQERAESFINNYGNALLSYEDALKMFLYEDHLYRKPLNSIQWKELSKLRELMLISKGEDVGYWNLESRHLTKWSY